MSQNTGKPSGVMNKRIPTLVGLGVLVVGLIVGIVLLGTGTNVFAPRATPETTPKQIRITNVSDNSFSVSFATDESTAGFLKYGTEEKKITTQSPDDRDKLTGSVASFTLHHITVSGLQPNTQYYYLLGTGGGTTYDNNGSAFMIKTTAKGGTPSAAKTAYGSVSTEAGSPADGAVVYINMEGIGELSALVKSSGSWAIPLSNARLKTDGTYAQITDETPISIEIKGTDPQQQVKYQTTVNKSQPVAALQFGKSPESAEVATVEKPATVEAASGSAEQADPTTKTQGGIKNLLDGDSDPGLTATETDPVWYGADSTASATLDLTNDKHQLINTDQPTFTGKAAPNVEVTIEIHSETEITQQLISNPDGSFSLNIEELSKQLEPGEHTVKYSYEDPNTGELVTKTQTFTVKPKSGGTNQLAQAAATPTPTPTPTPTATPKASPSPSPTPFGSGNPYPVGGSGSATKSATASSSASATRSAKVATSGAMPVSGSIGTTMTLIIGGLFFLLAGAWSFWISKEYMRQEE